MSLHGDERRFRHRIIHGQEVSIISCTVLEGNTESGQRCTICSQEVGIVSCIVVGGLNLFEVERREKLTLLANFYQYRLLHEKSKRHTKMKWTFWMVWISYRSRCDTDYYSQMERVGVLAVSTGKIRLKPTDPISIFQRPAKTE